MIEINAICQVLLIFLIVTSMQLKQYTNVNNVLKEVGCKPKYNPKKLYRYVWINFIVVAVTCLAVIVNWIVLIWK